MKLVDWMTGAGINPHQLGKRCGARSPATYARVVKDPSVAGKAIMRRLYIESLGRVTPNDLLIDEEWQSALADRLHKLAQDQRQP